MFFFRKKAMKTLLKLFFVLFLHHSVQPCEISDHGPYPILDGTVSIFGSLLDGTYALIDGAYLPPLHTWWGRGPRPSNRALGNIPLLGKNFMRLLREAASTPETAERK